jgi:hypothetical protein
VRVSAAGDRTGYLSVGQAVFLGEIFLEDFVDGTNNKRDHGSGVSKGRQRKKLIRKKVFDKPFTEYYTV